MNLNKYFNRNIYHTRKLFVNYFIMIKTNQIKFHFIQNKTNPKIVFFLIKSDKNLDSKY